MLLRHPAGAELFFGADRRARQLFRQPIENVEPEPQPDPIPQPDPEPQPDPVPEPDPIADPIPDPQPEPDLDPPPVMPSDVTMLSVIQFRGVTMTLDREMPVAVSALGDPILVSEEEFNILSISPESENIPGKMPDGSEAAFQAHGTMINPAAHSDQGWDRIMDITGASGQSVARWNWDAGLNVDPGMTGQPINVPAGWEGSLVKAVRRDGITNVGPWHLIDRYVVFSVKAEKPAAGAFRPGFCGTDKSIMGRLADVDWSVLRSVSINNSLVAPQLDGHDRIKETYPWVGQGGETLRRGNIPTVPGNSTYTGNYGGEGFQRAMGLLWLHSNTSRAAKEAFFLRAIQHGIDLHACVQAGWRGSRGAGQHHGYLPFLYFAAFALQSPELLESAQRMQANLDGQVRWTPENWIGQRTDWPGGGLSGDRAQYYKTYFKEDLHKPTWFMGNPVSQNIAGHLYARYKTTSTAPSMFETLAIVLLQNGPGGISGEEALRNGPADLTNDKAAILPWLDRWYHWTAGTSDSIQSTPRNLWASLRPLIDRPVCEGVPDHPPERDISFGSGDGFVRINTSSALGEANPPVTRRDARVSNDGGYSWRYIENYALGATIPAQNGAEHFLQIRQVNALGEGSWSANYRFERGSTDPFGRRVPNGTAVAAVPGFAPEIVYRPYPSWGGSNLFHEPLTDITGIYQVFAGWGTVTGGVPADASYQWMLDGVDIPGATERGYWLSESNGGKALSVRVTLSNAHGSVSQVSPPLRLPDAILPPLGEGEVFRCDFTNRVDTPVSAFIDSLLASQSSGTSSPRWRPGTQLVDEAGTGCVIAPKSGSWPSMIGYIDLSEQIGRSLRATAVMAVANQSGSDTTGGWSDPGDARVSLDLCQDNKGTGTESVTSGVGLERSSDRMPMVVSQTSNSFTPTPERPWLRVRVAVATSSGGSGGGNPNLTDVTITEEG